MKKKLLFFLFSFGMLCNGVSQSNVYQDGGSSSREIRVFPNPANNVINILGLANSSSATIFITDMSGTVVQQHQWEIRNNALNIPIPTLRSGLYYVSVRSTEQEVQKKFYKK